MTNNVQILHNYLSNLVEMLVRRAFIFGGNSSHW